MEAELTQEQIDFLKSHDFMRLGQGINQKNWQSVAMCERRMEANAKKCEMDVFVKWLVGIRQCSFSGNQAEALQLMTLVTTKRVQFLRLLEQK